MGFVWVLNVLALLLLISNIALFVIMHLRTNDYSIIYNAVSDYAIGNTNRLFRIYLWAGSLGYICLFCMVLLSPVLRLEKIFPILLALVIIFRILLGSFKTNIEGQKTTINGVKDLHQRWRLGMCEPLKAVLLGATLRVAA